MRKEAEMGDYGVAGKLARRSRKVVREEALRKRNKQRKKNKMRLKLLSRRKKQRTRL